MKEFLQKVDRLCFEYGYEMKPKKKPFIDHKTDTYINYIEISSETEKERLLYFDGDGIEFEN